MSIYMRMDGINGNVTAENYQHWIKIDDIDFGGIQNSMNNIVGKTRIELVADHRLGKLH